MPLGIITLEDVLEGELYSSCLLALTVPRTNSPKHNLELIGEEIYDEFDQQGAHGDPYKVPPIQDEKLRDPVTGVEAATSKTAPILPVHMPTALRGFGGFGFLKSRSTPPVPGEESDMRDETYTPVYNLEGDKTDGASHAYTLHTQPPPNVEILEPVIGHAPTTVIQKDNLSNQAPPSETPTSLPAFVAVEGKTKSMPLSTVTPSATVLAPPLETALLERKRRMVASRPSSPVGSIVNIGVPGTPTTSAMAPVRGPHMKGSRFKSSPLGVGESAGVEKVNEVGRVGAGTQEVSGGDEEDRMLSETHKDDLDK